MPALDSWAARLGHDVAQALHAHNLGSCRLSPDSLATSLNQLALILFAAGYHEQSTSLCQHGMRVFAREGFYPGLIQAWINLARMDRLCGQLAAAQKKIDQLILPQKNLGGYPLAGNSLSAATLDLCHNVYLAETTKIALKRSDYQLLVDLPATPSAMASEAKMLGLLGLGDFSGALDTANLAMEHYTSHKWIFVFYTALILHSLQESAQAHHILVGLVQLWHTVARALGAKASPFGFALARALRDHGHADHSVDVLTALKRHFIASGDELNLWQALGELATLTKLSRQDADIRHYLAATSYYAAIRKQRPMTAQAPLSEQMIPGPIGEALDLVKRGLSGLNCTTEGLYALAN